MLQPLPLPIRIMTDKRAFKALILLLVFLLPISFTSLAQETKMKIPVITLGRIHATEVKNGKIIPTPCTRQQILKYNLLIADVNNCQVTEFKCTIIASGRPLYGPIYVTGPELTDAIKNKIKELDGPGVKVFIEDIKMNYRGTIMDAAPVVVAYDN